jgi:hypothetical protein
MLNEGCFGQRLLNMEFTVSMVELFFERPTSNAQRPTFNGLHSGVPD